MSDLRPDLVTFGSGLSPFTRLPFLHQTMHDEENINYRLLAAHNKAALHGRVQFKLFGW